MTPAVYLVLIVAAAVISSISTFGVKRLAEWVGCIDEPDERKIHTVATPRLGGLSIILGFVIPLLALSMIPRAAQLVQKNLDYLFAVLISGSIIIGLGVYDDLFGSNASKKFTVQTIAAAVLVGFGFRFETLSLAGMSFELGPWLGPLLTMIWVVGVINAVNFIDGMDGLATLVTFTIAVAFAILSILRGDIFSLVIMTTLAGSLLGFFPWNQKPAKIFMGDTGSLFIGLLLATVSIARSTKSPTALVVAGPILALALPVLDTLLVMRGRFFERNITLSQRFLRMFNADRSHFHHLLDLRYGSHFRAVLTVWLITVLFATAGILTVVQQTKFWGYSIGIASAILMIALRLGMRRGGDEPPVTEVGNQKSEITSTTVGV